jgi:hypothetical protein
MLATGARQIVTRENLAEIAVAVAAGQALAVVPVAPTSYARQFQHTDWIDFVDPVQAGGGNGFNERFHALESEFDLIAAAITSADASIAGIESTPPAVGLTVVVAISDGAQIPIPTGFSASETKYFAFIKTYAVSVPQPGTEVGFQVFASDTGTVTVRTFPLGAPTPNQSVLATGVAIAKRGGW